METASNVSFVEQKLLIVFFRFLSIRNMLNHFYTYVDHSIVDTLHMQFVVSP